MPRSEGYVSAEYLRKAAELTRHIKLRSYELMEIKPGHRVLDVGCGPGIDTVPLSRLVGEAGSVRGIDMDEEMIAEADAFAKREGCAARIRHVAGNIPPLPFRDSEFDSCRADRLFQVLPATVNTHRVLDEMLRVTRPGGKIVLVDTDWATASVDFDDSRLERKLVTFFAEALRPNGYAGRQFYRMFKERGFKDVVVEFFPLFFGDFFQTLFAEWLSKEALKQGVAKKKEINAWLKTLSGLSSKGQFYCTCNMTVAAGRK